MYSQLLGAGADHGAYVAMLQANGALARALVARGVGAAFARDGGAGARGGGPLALWGACAALVALSGALVARLWSRLGYIPQAKAPGGAHGP